MSDRYAYQPARVPADCDVCGREIEVGDMVTVRGPATHEHCHAGTSGVERGALDSGWSEWGVPWDDEETR